MAGASAVRRSPPRPALCHSAADARSASDEPRPVADRPRGEGPRPHPPAYIIRTAGGAEHSANAGHAAEKEQEMSLVRLLPAWLHAIADYAVAASLIVVA